MWKLVRISGISTYTSDAAAKAVLRRQVGFIAEISGESLTYYCIVFGEGRGNGRFLGPCLPGISEPPFLKQACFKYSFRANLVYLSPGTC